MATRMKCQSSDEKDLRQGKMYLPSRWEHIEAFINESWKSCDLAYILVAEISSLNNVGVDWIVNIIIAVVDIDNYIMFILLLHPLPQ